jgi:hypothetical protein
LRMADQLILYSFGSSSVTASTSVTVTFSALTNPPTSSTFNAVVSTYDNATPTVMVDTGTAGSVTMGAVTGSVAISVGVDPAFTFSVAGANSNCNGLVNSIGANATPTAVPLGRISSGTRSVGVQNLTLSSNADAGFSVYLRSTAASSPVLTGSGSRSIADASSGALPSATTPAFGYTTNDASVAMGSGNVGAVPNRSGSTTVMSLSSPTASQTSCVAYFASAGSATPADSYKTTVVYTAVPMF